MNIDTLKKLAAEKAVEEIKDGMVVGLGTGSTFHFTLLKIAELIKSGELKNIVCVSSSKQTELKATELGIPLISLNELYKQKPNLLAIDLTIDGADEVAISHPEQSEGSNEFNLIKGGGGALLREKIIVQASKKFIVVVDESKLSKKLGMNFPVPVEVLQFAVEAEKCFLESLGAKITIRKNSDGEHLITDEGNFIIDASVNEITNVNEFANMLEQRAGIVEHGLFRSNLVNKVVCSLHDGSIKEFENKIGTQIY